MATIYTDAGEELVVDILDGTTAPPTWYIGWGTGAGTAAKADTALFVEASETRIAATMSQPSINISRFLAELTADAGKTITNAGVLSLVASGILLIHGDFTGVVLALNDKIEFTIEMTQS